MRPASVLRDGWLLRDGDAHRRPGAPAEPRRPGGRRHRDGPGAASRRSPSASRPGSSCGSADLVDLPALATAYVVLLTLALGTRAFHWDGLADTADGLTASYSAERSLEVMRTGPVGPAGVVAVVLVSGLQAAGLAAVVRHEHAWWAVALLVCASRSTLALACARGVPAARTDGLGATHIGAVPAIGALASLLVGAVAIALAGHALGSVGPALVGLVLMVAAVIALVFRCVRRLGGITGDVLGAAVEVSLAVLVLAASTA